MKLHSLKSLSAFSLNLSIKSSQAQRFTHARAHTRSIAVAGWHAQIRQQERQRFGLREEDYVHIMKARLVRTRLRFRRQNLQRDMHNA